MKPADRSSEERVMVLLKQAQAQLQQNNAQDAAQSIASAIQQQEVSQEDGVDATARIETLERELRFAMGLMALLLMTGVWGFWRGALYEKPRPSGAAGGSGVMSPGMASKRGMPAPVRRLPRPVPRGPQKLAKSALMPRARLAPSKLLRPVFRKRPKKPRNRLGTFAPPGKRKALAVTRLRPRPTLRKVARRRVLRRRVLRRRRRLRFGDPALPSEVPPQWCGKRLRYGPYYPCLKRRGRRCIKRSKQRKYGCLRIRRRR